MDYIKKGIETDYPFTDIANEWYHGNVLFTKSHRPFRALNNQTAESLK